MDLDLLNEDLEAMQDDLPFYASFGGNQYRCNIISMTDKQREFLENSAGNRIEWALSFVISELPQQIEIKEIVIFQNVEYRVIQTQLSPDLIEQRVYLTGKYAS